MRTSSDRIEMKGRPRGPRQVAAVYARFYEARVQEALATLANEPLVTIDRGSCTLQNILDRHVMAVFKATGYNRSMTADLLGEHRRSFQRQLKGVARRLGVEFPAAPAWPTINIDVGAVIYLRRQRKTWQEIAVAIGHPTRITAIRKAVRRALESEVEHVVPAAVWDGLLKLWDKSKIKNFSLFCEQAGLPPSLMRQQWELARERRKLLAQDPKRNRRRSTPPSSEVVQA